MSHHLAIEHLLKFVERHGYALIFVWVLAEQGALPIPSAPLLLAVGALIHAGRLNTAPAVLCCTAAALLADTVWFELGRVRGYRVLRLVCRVSLEPDSCVRQTENAFLKYGMRSLLAAKFVPGLNSVAAPLAGLSGASYLRFLLYDTPGILLWCGAYLAAGFLFSEQLEIAMGYAARMGSNLLLVIIALLAGWIAWKWIQRRRFIKQLDVARITPAELQQRLRSGEELFIVDLRTELITGHAALIPGAVQMSYQEVPSRSHEIPRDRDIILFCS